MGRDTSYTWNHPEEISSLDYVLDRRNIIHCFYLSLLPGGPLDIIMALPAMQKTIFS